MSSISQATYDAIVATKKKRKLAIEIAHKALLGAQDQPAAFAQALMNSGFFYPQQIPVSATQDIWRDYGRFLARMGFLEEACLALDIALWLEPNCYVSLVDAGTARFTLGQFSSASNYFSRAMVLQPQDPAPVASLAAIHARQGKGVEARKLALRALAIDPDLLTAQLSLARADLLEGQVKRTDARMSEQLKRTDISDQQRISLLDLRAEARDKANLCDEAFLDYSERNDLLIRLHGKQIAAIQPEREIEKTLRISNYFRQHMSKWSTWPGDGNEAHAQTARGHVFLVGFPRSGTTLIEKALAGHPDIVTLEEIDSLHGISDHWTAENSRLNSLVSPSPDTTSLEIAKACRAAYWDTLKAAARTDISQKIIIDKMPLYSLQLPVIARLFPNAKILFAIRDPRDVVLSCFRRRFRINPAMFEFLSLTGTAHYYDAMMTHAAHCRTILPLQIFDMRHETIVQDFDREIGSILNFLGLNWNDAVRQFSQRAALRPLTPSDPQLVRGLSAEGIGQWRRYRKPLNSVLSVLAPSVASFGYSVD